MVETKNKISESIINKLKERNMYHDRPGPVFEQLITDGIEFRSGLFQSIVQYVREHGVVDQTNITVVGVNVDGELIWRLNM
jgi:DNA gyrase inhibitor GyrI